MRKHLADAIVSAVNYSEVLKKTIEYGGLPEVARAFMRNISLRVIPFDEQQAVASAALYPQTKTLGLSFADRACLALGVSKQLAVLTADGDWASIELPIKVKLIRAQH